jgi:hypothetical protein
MVPVIQPCGKSFKGLATYLTHDPEAKTAERVGWTHTLNCAHDHVPSAVDEMLWTARNAELLKQEAGIRAGGRATESPVKHFSLNWSPEDMPTKEHMIETAEGYLRHMGWQDHQVLLVAHTDKEYAHVHGMLNCVHPETGLRLNDDFEQRRTQKWALEYERENGHIYCEQRLKNANEREDGLTRPAWMSFADAQKAFTRDEKELRDNQPILIGEENKSKIANFDEWKKLKDFQRQERQDFFADGKSAFSELRSSIYREVREEYRERWGEFYAAGKNGTGEAELAKLKTALIAEQKETLESRRDEACKELRNTRDTAYRGVLDDQRGIRLSMRSRQEAGLDNGVFIDQLRDGTFSKDRAAAFRDAAGEVTAPREKERTVVSDSFATSPKRERSGIKSGTDIGTNLGMGLGFSFLSFFEGLADGLVPSNPDPRPRRPEPEPRGADLFDNAVADAHKREEKEREEAADEYLRRQRSSGD